MNLRRLAFCLCLSLFPALMAYAGPLDRYYAVEFLARQDFRYGVQQSEDVNAPAACYTFNIPAFSPSKLAFGHVTIGEQKSLVFRIQNGDNGAETRIDSIQSLNKRFEVTSTPKLPYCLANDKFVDIEVTFTPVDELELVSQIKIRHTSFNKDVSTSIIVSGKGKQGVGQLTVNPESIDFGQVSVGQSLQKTFTIDPS